VWSDRDEAPGSLELHFWDNLNPYYKRWRWAAVLGEHLSMAYQYRSASMRKAECIRVFDSQGEDYKRAFQVFLNYTDQKRNAKRWLQ
jgi:hypothetical protein